MKYGFIALSALLLSALSFLVMAWLAQPPEIKPRDLPFIVAVQIKKPSYQGSFIEEPSSIAICYFPAPRPLSLQHVGQHTFDWPPIVPAKLMYPPPQYQAPHFTHLRPIRVRILKSDKSKRRYL